ncbi:hypothetical protein PUN28_016840 [Cardiocondyla obscurior]|uniref:Uncharacterized protein n=1 Tax=Cardiocondyla obscurior TaxID=286306 RepID=A0AAW2ENY5_9HYME
MEYFNTNFSYARVGLCQNSLTSTSRNRISIATRLSTARYPVVLLAPSTFDSLCPLPLRHPAVSSRRKTRARRLPRFPRIVEGAQLPWLRPRKSGETETLFLIYPRDARMELKRMSRYESLLILLPLDEKLN